jgi:WD40 repeat protein
MVYQAFISYSHAADGRLAPALQSALHGFARPWYRMRALHVFRDTTSLSASPELWAGIERALGESEFFLLLASPEAARSPWVGREVEWWLAHRSAAKLLIVLTGGELAWDTVARDFDSARTTALPPALHGKLADEPLWVDLRWAKSESLSLRHTQFRAAVLDLAAPLHGRPKDELDGEDVRQHRKTRRIASAAVAAIVVFAVAAAVLAFVAVRQRDLAEQRLRIALGRGLAIQSAALRTQGPDLLPLSSLLAAEALRRFPSLEADQAVRASLALLPLPRARLPHDGAVKATAFSPQGDLLATASRDGAVVWDAATGRRLRALPHKSVHAIAFRADGALLATAGDGGVRLWDPRTGRSAGPPLATAGFSQAVAWSPDGKWIATTDRDRRVRMRDASTGRVAAEMTDEIGNKERLASLVFSPDSRYLAKAGYSRVQLWEVPSGRATPPEERDDMTTTAFSPNSGLLAAGSRSGGVRVWETATLRQVWTEYPGEEVSAITFSPDGKRVAVAGGTAVMLWDATSGQNPLRLRAERVLAVVFSPDGQRLATASENHTAQLWDAATGEEVARMVHDGAVRTIAFHPSGQSLATGSDDGTAGLWETKGGGEVARIEASIDPADLAFTPKALAIVADRREVDLWESATGRIRHTSEDDNATSAVLSPDGCCFAESSGETAVVRALPDGRVLARLPHGPPVNWDEVRRRRMARGESYRAIPPEIERLRREGSVRVLALSPEGRFLVTSRSDEVARLWDVQVHRLAASVRAALFSRAAFSADGRYAAVTTPDGLRLWETASGKTAADVAAPEGLDLFRFVPAPDGERLLAVGNDTARLLRVEGGREILHIQQAPRIFRAAASSDGRFLATVNGEEIEIREAGGSKESGGTIRASASMLAFSPDGLRLATAGADHTLRIWEVATRRQVAALERDEESEDLIFSPDGKVLAEGPRLWDLAGEGSEAAQVTGQAAAFSPDGRFLVTTTDGMVRLWLWRPDDLAAALCTRLSRNLTRAEWKRYVGDEPYRRTCPNLPEPPPRTAP